MQFLKILILIFTFSIYANQPNCESLYSKFSQFDICYSPGLCQDNIYYLIKEIKERHPDEDLTQAKVLFVYSRWSGKNDISLGLTRVNSTTSKNGIPQEWKYHVVLKLKGKIYDFDHNKEQIAVPINKYFNDMFSAEFYEENGKKIYSETDKQKYLTGYDEPRPAKDSKLRLHVREIPASEFQKDYSFSRSNNPKPGIKNWAYWFNNEKDYPDKTLEDFLIQHSQ